MASENYNSDFSGYIVDPKKFLTPEMGDYYIGAIDDTYLKKINSIIENKDSSKTNKKDAQKAAYYTEKPDAGFFEPVFVASYMNFRLFRYTMVDVLECLALRMN